MSQPQDLQLVQEYVTGLFEVHQTPDLYFHNLQHTVNVVLHAVEIADSYALDEHQRITLLTAAWFHDTGHLFTAMEGHEEKSVAVMNEFLTERRLMKEDIPIITQCILSTRVPQQPISLLDQILCDADLYDLGTDYFTETNVQVRKEVESRNKIVINDWPEQSLSFLTNHAYFTDYCRQLLSKGKERNIRFLRQVIAVGKGMRS